MSIENTPTSQIGFPNVISLSDVTELPQFEDIVAHDIYAFKKAEHLQAWQGRIALRNLIRPPKFNGSIHNIEMIAMEEPYDRLLDTVERGWFLPGYNNPRYDLDRAREETRGFVFSADAKSTGRGVIGQIQAEIWYMMVLRDKSGSFQLTRSNSPVFRRMTKPKLETEKFIEVHEDARKVGLQVLRQNMMNPLRGGLPRT